MERKEFISYLGFGAGSLIISSCLGACGKSDSGSPVTPPTPGTNGKVDFSIDVSTNSDILSKGWTIQNRIIIAKNGAGYIALSSICTHQQSSMTYSPSTNTFPCSRQEAGHGSVFDANGAKIKGPATSDLKRYNTTLNGNILRVFES